MKTFMALRCRKIFDKYYLSADLAQECWVGDHANWGAPLAYVMIAIYCVGIPVGTYVTLRRYRASLYDPEHPRHMQTLRRYGNLYGQVSRKPCSRAQYCI